MLSFVGDEIGLDIHDDTPDWLSGLDGQVEINLKIKLSKQLTSLLKIFNGFLTLIALGSIVPGLARLMSLLEKYRCGAVTRE